MRITDLLKKEGIARNVQAVSKEAAINSMVELQFESGNISDKDQYRKDILEREGHGSTAIGEGIAIPHAKSSAVKRAGLVAVTIPSGVDFDSLDGQPTHLLFMIAAPKEGGDIHLEVLSRLSTLLMDDSFRKNLIAAKSDDEFLKIIDDKETEKFGAEQNSSQSGNYRILAVTAYPTGIAHTFMAAEALANKGKEMSIPIKVETNGSGGAKNVLTKKEIEEADGVIIAADKKVDMARFEGKRVLQVKVSDGIHKPEELIQKVMNGKAPVYHHNGAVDTEEEGESESVGRQIYKHLMNGVSHMLPFVIGGGILIAIAFLLDDYSIDPKNFGSNTPVAAFFKSIGGTAFGFMLPILAGYIAMSIADRPGLAVGFVGGSLASLGISFTNPGGGVSAGFLGALLAGFAGGYLVLGLKKLFDKLPSSLEGLKPILLYPVLGILGIGIIMGLFNPIVGELNTMLSNGLNSLSGTSKILLGCIVGGMMSIDMGGPFNKAAYLFGTAALASNNFDIMAAVMVGGMVPPLVIALSTTFFKNKYSESDRKSGVVNYVMGLCFISEGAIPYAAADPLRVLPSCIIGSAIAGGISMAMGCTLGAPHGGIFVLLVIGNRIGFVIALAAGSIIGALLLGILKKPVKQS